MCSCQAEFRKLICQIGGNDPGLSYIKWKCKSCIDGEGKLNCCCDSNSSCCIGDMGAEKLAVVLPLNSTLTKLCLDGISIGDVGAKALARALCSNRNAPSALTHLSLRNNNIGADGAVSLALYLFEDDTRSSITEKSHGEKYRSSLFSDATNFLSNGTQLVQFDLTGNQIGPDGARHISSALAFNSTLSVLSLGYNSVGDPGAKSLSHMIRRNSTVSTLKIEGNDIGWAGCKAVAHALWDNTTLVELNLSDNPATGHEDMGGMDAIGDALIQNNTLTWLFLRNCSIGDKGVEALVERVGRDDSMTSIAVLDLRDNAIALSGALSLAQAIRRKWSLNCLNLSGNSNLGDSSALALTDVLRNNDTLKELRLCGCGIGSKTAVVMGKVLANHSTMEMLDLEGNNLDIECVKVLEKLMNHNHIRARIRVGAQKPEATKSVER